MLLIISKNCGEFEFVLYVIFILVFYYFVKYCYEFILVDYNKFFENVKFKLKFFLLCDNIVFKD